MPLVILHHLLNVSVQPAKKIIIAANLNYLTSVTQYYRNVYVLLLSYCYALLKHCYYYYYRTISTLLVAGSIPD
jgi:hypothetical protein